MKGSNAKCGIYSGTRHAKKCRGLLCVRVWLCSGTQFDPCGKCGGDNSSCTGCDGVPVSPAVTARLKVAVHTHKHKLSTCI